MHLSLRPFGGFAVPGSGVVTRREKKRERKLTLRAHFYRIIVCSFFALPIPVGQS